MSLRSLFGRIALPLVRVFPHRQVSLPYPKDRRLTLRFYPDSELGLWLGFNEPRVIDWWMEHISEGDIVYDVGAHIGVYSLLAAVRGADAHAFEPAPDAFHRLENNANLNEGRIEANECVVSESTGSATLHLSTDGRRHSIRQVSEDETTRTVPSTTIDAYSDGLNQPDVVKVDVEGAGHRVLNGAKTTIDDGSSTWLIEIHNQDERNAIDDHFGGSDYEQRWLDDRHIVVEPTE